MSLDRIILNLVASMKEVVGVNVVFGKRDHEASVRPIIELVPEEDGTITTNNTIANTLSLPLTVNIVVDDKDELRAYVILEESIKFLNTIAPEKGYTVGNGVDGGVLSATINQTYGSSIFTLSIPFTITEIITGA